MGGSWFKGEVLVKSPWCLREKRDGKPLGCVFQVGGSRRDPWRCKMPSEMLLPRGAQQRDGINEAGVEGLMCARVVGRGGILPSGLLGFRSAV